MQNKNEGKKSKIIIGDLNCTMDKIDMDGENETQRLYRSFPIVPCENSSRIMGLSIYGEQRTQIPPSSPATIGPLSRIQDTHGLY